MNEDELREALRRQAAGLQPDPEAGWQRFSTVSVRPRARRLLLPGLAAAVVVGVTATAFALTSHPHAPADRPAVGAPAAVRCPIDSGEAQVYFTDGHTFTYGQSSEAPSVPYARNQSEVPSSSVSSWLWEFGTPAGGDVAASAPAESAPDPGSTPSTVSDLPEQAAVGGGDSPATTCLPGPASALGSIASPSQSPGAASGAPSASAVASAGSCSYETSAVIPVGSNTVVMGVSCDKGFVELPDGGRLMVDLGPLTAAKVATPDDVQDVVIGVVPLRSGDSVSFVVPGSESNGSADGTPISAPTDGVATLTIGADTWLAIAVDVSTTPFDLVINGLNHAIVSHWPLAVRPSATG